MYEGKVVDLSKVDIDKVRRTIQSSLYKALDIDNLRTFIEESLEQLINKNCTRLKFSQRYRAIIDQYNSGSSENEEYYEKLLELVDQLKQEQSRSSDMGLAEEELEIFDLLVKGRKLTKKEEQKVILASKNLYNKLIEQKSKLMVVDWYKDDQPREKVLSLIVKSLGEDLPESYDKDVFTDKTTLLLNHFVDMAAQGYGWTA